MITVLSLLVSLVFAYKAWGTSHPNVFWAFCLMLLLLVPTVIGFGFYMLPRTSLGKKVLLEAPEAEDLTPYLEESRRLEKLVGRFGTAISMLNPGGLVNVDGQRLHACSDGLTIGSGESVEVTDVRGSRIVVKPGSPPASEPDSPERLSENRDPSTLDFDFPPVSE